MKQIAIIGGGAAGLMTAATLAEKLDNQAEIHLFEKNSQLGNKIRISGGGRCNITTGYYKKQDLQSKYIRGREFLSYSISQFGPRKMQQRCADNDCPVYCQDDMRCFPVSNKGSDVVAMFEKILQKGNIQIHFTESVKSIVKTIDSNSDTNSQVEDQYIGNIKNIRNTLHDFPTIKTQFTITTSKSIYDFDFVVITTGGNAYGKSGSTGDGYTLAQSVGHTITQLGPSLHSFLIAEEWLKECSGISFSNATLRFPIENNTTEENNNLTEEHRLTDNKTSHKKNLQDIKISPSRIQDTVTISGPILFTHFGISGPITFALSAHLAYNDFSQTSPKTVYCKPFSDHNYEWRVDFFTKKTQENPKQHLSTILEKELPKRRVEGFLNRIDISSPAVSKQNIGNNSPTNLFHIQLANFSTEQKKHIANLLGNGFPITLLARRPGDEFVTAGGVDTREVNPKTMESLLCPGLYFAGEILDIDAVTGGFNFQAARSTGRCVGESIYSR